MTIEKKIIPTYNVENLKKAIAKLNRKAVKLGCEEMKLTFAETAPFVSIVHPITGGHLVNPIIIEQVEATLEFEIPTLDGWELIAKLDIYASETGTVVLVSAVPEKEVPEMYKNLDSINCDHCGWNRYRNHSILIRHMETGEYKQVGSTCVKDFFAGNDPRGFMFVASIKFDTIIGGLKEEDGFGSNGYNYTGYDLMETLTMTAAAIKKWGWLSKSKSYHYSQPSTAEHVLDNLNPHPNMPISDKCFISDDDKATAEATLEFWKNVNPENNDYLLNCTKLVKMGYVPSKFMGFACSMVSTYQREMEKNIVKADMPESNHVGQVGDRLKRVQVKVLYAKNIESDWGVSTLYGFQDSLGNIYKTFYSGSNWSADKDDVLIIDGTIKKHDEFKGSKQTMLNRVAASAAAA